MLSLLLLACNDGTLKLDDTATEETTDTVTETDETDETDGITDTTTTTDDTTGVTLSLTFLDGRLLDPTLSGDPALRLEVTASAPCDLAVAVGAYSLEEVSLSGDALSAEVVWWGYDAYDLLDPGGYTLTATCGGASIEETLFLADLHIAALNFTGTAEATDGHVPLAFHKRDAHTPGVTVIAEEVPEYWSPDTDGWWFVADAEATWDDVEAPPWTDDALAEGHNIAAGYVAGALPRASLELAALPDGAPAVRLTAEGDALAWADSYDWRSDTTLLLTADQPLPGTLGRQDHALIWRFESQTPDGDWLQIPGYSETTHRIYRLADAPALLDGEDIGASPAVPWIAVLEEIDAAVSGVPATTEDVMEALRDFIYTNPDYVYNPSDRAYSTYEGDYAYWDWIVFEMTDWLEHNDGADMYCHSTSCFLSVLAGTVGVDAPQYVIGHYFDTNLLLPAGSSSWQSFSFYSHSVTSPDGGNTIWDAAVMVDDDGDPEHFPVTPAAVSGVSFEHYFDGLTVDTVEFVHDTACYLQ